MRASLNQYDDCTVDKRMLQKARMSFSKEVGFEYS